MAHTHLERERKFESPNDVALPDLTRAIPGASERVDRTTLRAVYYDTAARHLQRRSITLRRRAGGADAGWHLKLPADLDRLEVQVPSRSTTVPRELSELVKGVRFAQPLTAAATLETTRVRHLIEDASGELIAEVAEDDVAATVNGDADAHAWREVEVELGPAGDDEALEALTALLKHAGMLTADYPAKYARAVGEPPEHDRPAKLAGLVDDYLQEQYDALAEHDLQMRRGENRVHKMRVAVRRTRSTLRVFSDLFDQDAAATLDAELKWFAEALGRARDLDIVQARLADRIETTPADLLLGPVAADISSALAADRAAAGDAVAAALNGRRYRSLLLMLEAWRTDTPWTAIADEKASAAEQYVRRARKQTRRRLKRAIDSGVDADFHSARKAAKRHRYAAELVEPRAGKSARRTVRQMTEMQDDLGELQDSVTCAATLLDLARRLDDGRDRSGFSYGLLYGQELTAAADVKRRLAKRYG